MLLANILVVCALLSIAYRQWNDADRITCFSGYLCNWGRVPLVGDAIIGVRSSFGRVRHESSGSHRNFLLIGSHLWLRLRWACPGPHAGRQSLQVAYRVR